MEIKFKKIGNHWYPDIIHDNVNDLILDKKLEYFLSRASVFKDTISIYFQKRYNLSDCLQINENDINRYFITDDEFSMEFYIYGISFKISSKLYQLFENQYHFDFHKNQYNILWV